MYDLLTKMWKQDLNTTDDPSNGRWVDEGPNHSAGLLGGLNDSANGTELDENNTTIDPAEMSIQGINVFNNLNGFTPDATAAVSQTTGQSTTSEHTYSNEIKAGVTINVEAGAIFAKAGVEVSVAYTHLISDSTSNTVSNMSTTSQSVAVKIPHGKVFMVCAIGTTQVARVPYRCVARVEGNTETNFERTVNGHYNWRKSIGAAFGIAQQPGYADAGNGQGRAELITGTLIARSTSSFTTRILDVTLRPDLYSNPAASPQLREFIKEVDAQDAGNISPNGHVVVYDDAEYRGASQIIGVGRYDLSAIRNDTISSLRVPAGMKVTLYADVGFSGSSKTFTQDTSFVGADFNDRTSSMIVELLSVGGTPPPLPAGATGIYIVQSGDTLFRIAQRVYGDGDQWPRIRDANPGIVPDNLQIGQRIVIPAGGSEPTNVPPPPAPGTRTYVVQSGDTLFAIAQRIYGDGSQWPRIRDANPGIDPDNLQIGQRIVIPAGGSEPANVPPPPAPGARTYVVRSGDTLFAIAQRIYGDGSQWPRIRDANPGIVPDNLQIGQQILIP